MWIGKHPDSFTSLVIYRKREPGALDPYPYRQWFVTSECISIHFWRSELPSADPRALLVFSRRTHWTSAGAILNTAAVKLGIAWHYNNNCNHCASARALFSKTDLVAQHWVLDSSCWWMKHFTIEFCLRWTHGAIWVHGHWHNLPLSWTQWTYNLLVDHTKNREVEFT